MLYKKNNEAALSDSLFKNPTAEYRGTPFWAWNDNLDKNELLWQIDRLNEMGFGGFHMHTRAGMATPYLSDEFMELISACVHHAKDKKMLAWLYDEDRWPSGAAGGFVTKNKNYRQKHLILSPEYNDDVFANKRFSNYVGRTDSEIPSPIVNDETGYKDGLTYLLTAFDVVKDENGRLVNYQIIDPSADVKGEKWYAYVTVDRDSGWYNGQAYFDVFNKDAVAEFLKVTHDTYYKSIGTEFDKTVPAVFTDEPQFSEINRAAFGTDVKPLSAAWSTEFPVSFRLAYGYDLVEKLPEIFWDLQDGKPSLARYHYHDHTAALFAECFTKQYGDWCREHGISMTGHFMEEPTLQSQTNRIGEAMRHYCYMGLPGVDMLCDAVELTTAKQTASCVHQYGKEGMTSELYGVTGWDFDFRGHKFQGDWQAALGVTVRVPHLSWYSMKGSAKRDYPASIHYQSGWYNQYGYIENHFARVNTALTRGKPCIKVGVIHPIESFWLHYGPNDSNSAYTNQLEKLFADLPRWLLEAQIDFDFISEATLPTLYGGCENGKITVGQMQYEAIILPTLETIRSTTLQALKAFETAGGRVILLGENPKYVDAQPSDAAADVCNAAVKVPLTANTIADALNEQRDVLLIRDNGVRSSDYIYQKRIDGKFEWLFICRVNKKAPAGTSTLPNAWAENMTLTYRGRKIPKLYDTLSGEIRDVSYRFNGENTLIPLSLYESDSVLLRFEDAPADSTATDAAESLQAPALTRSIDYKTAVAYTRTEPNVLVLDMPEWSENGKNYYPTEEMLRIDALLRKKYSYPDATGGDLQPWLLAGETIVNFPYLRFTFNSEISVACELAFEELTNVWLNGKKVTIQKNGYFTDKRIYKMPLGKLKKGKNVIIAQVPIGKRLSLENLFLLGNFDVRVNGATATVVPMSNTISFGSVVHQGLPFYGAGLSYQLPFECGLCDVKVHAPWYKGALISAELDGKPVGNVVFAPYDLIIRDVPAGKHTLSLTLHITRVNTFGGLHNTACPRWIGPNTWFSKADAWSYEYQLKDNGILKSPILEIYDK